MTEKVRGQASRRRFVAGAAGVSLAAAVGSALSSGTNASAAVAQSRMRANGVVAKGLNTNIPTPSFGVMVFNRMGYGPRRAAPYGDDLAYFVGLGVTTEERLNAYVTEQINPDNIDDSECDNSLADPEFTTMSKSLVTQWYDHHRNYRNNGMRRDQPVREIERASFTRAVYSRRQLLELIVNFWHDHFNVYGYDNYAQSTWVHYDRDVIRANAFGNFRTMLEGVAKSPAMLYYLDNYTNSAGGPNENYARELFELHTLGAMNYYGLIPANQVPTDGNGQPLGYVDNDIYEATRCFTGWKVSDGSTRVEEDADTGRFYYHDAWHDRFQKSVLGTLIPNDQGPERDGLDVLDLLAYHRGTAQHIAFKLCRRLIGDNPPQSVVDAAAQTFYDNRNHQSQIKRTLKTILLSDEFSDVSTFPSKVKRPFEMVTSAMRAGRPQIVPRPDHYDTDQLLWRIQRAGQRPFQWRTPDGFPDEGQFWLNGTSLIQTWRTIDWLLDETDNDERLLDVLVPVENGIPNLQDRTPEKIVDFLMQRILGYVPPGSTNGWIGDPVHTAVTDFYRQSHQDGKPPWPRDFPVGTDDRPGIETDSWPYYWRQRLRGSASLIFSSPYFVQR